MLSIRVALAGEDMRSAIGALVNAHSGTAAEFRAALAALLAGTSSAGRVAL
jgi:hypothetical protein